MGLILCLFVLQLIYHVLNLIYCLFYLYLRFVWFGRRLFWDAELHRRVDVLVCERDLHFLCFFNFWSGSVVSLSPFAHWSGTGWSEGWVSFFVNCFIQIFFVWSSFFFVSRLLWELEIRDGNVFQILLRWILFFYLFMMELFAAGHLGFVILDILTSLTLSWSVWKSIPRPLRISFCKYSSLLL